MQRRNFDPQPWYIVPVKPGAEASFRRWNFVIISILAALVLGLFLAAIFPQAPPGSAHHKAPTRVHKNLALVSLEEFESL
jgi:hypothetical protein